jgi:hypothetical protein
MNVDALVLALVAIADMAFLVHLRRRRSRLERQERMMTCLRIAIHRANQAETHSDPWPLPRAG